MTVDVAPTSPVLPFAPPGGLTFGIYHGGVVESPHELATGKPDSPDQINRALDQLQSSRHFLVRKYIRFTGTEADVTLRDMPSIADVARYTWNGRKLDLVLSNWDRAGNMTRWTSFIERAIERYGEYVQNLQICDEPNVFEYPGDGRFGHSVEAVLTGLKVARTTLRRRGLNALTGFNSVPALPVSDFFWNKMSRLIDNGVLNTLDYVGLNLYLDVTEPLVGDIEDAVTRGLTCFRNVTLANAGILPSIPMHICESGWPTGPNRFYSRQAELLQRMVRTVYQLRSSLNITQFELFALRDADTANPDFCRQFGIMRDDYTPKPAFETYRRLIQEMGN